MGRVYRYPFLDELVSYYGYGSDTLYRDLDAEKGVTAEAGVELGDHPVWRAGATLFRLDMEDEVAWDPVAYRNANLDRTRRQGVEVWGRWRPAAGRIEVELSYTFTDARFRAGPADGCDVPLVPRHQALGVVRAALPRDFWADATVRYQGSAPLGGDVLNAGDELDAFTTGDLAVRYKPEGKRFSLFLGVENVTDEVYATVAYHGAFEDGYYPAPGRCWRAGMNWTF